MQNKGTNRKVLEAFGVGVVLITYFLCGDVVGTPGLSYSTKSYRFLAAHEQTRPNLS